MGNSTAKPSPSTQADLPREHVLHGDGRRSCAILGATGATGKEMVYAMCQSKEWGRITIIHRRELDLKTLHAQLERAADKPRALTEDEMKKVTHHVMPLDDLCKDSTVKLFANHDVCFCVLGTKRAIAGSAAKFKKVDFEYVRDGAIASRNAGVKHFSLLTSKGANAECWANDWKITHGLLYLRTKGLAENAVIQQGFSRVSIFRPGMLGKPGQDSFVTKIGLMTATHVSQVGRVMIMDAESTDAPDYPETKESAKDAAPASEEDGKEDGAATEKKEAKEEAAAKDDEKKEDKEASTLTVRNEKSKEVIFYEKEMIDAIATDGAVAPGLDQAGDAEDAVDAGKEKERAKGSDNGNGGDEKAEPQAEADSNGKEQSKAAEKEAADSGDAVEAPADANADADADAGADAGGAE